MCIELYNSEGNSIVLTQDEWKVIRDKAQGKGWKPEGTSSDIPGWQGSYRLSETAHFKPSDLTRFKEALEQVQIATHVKNFITSSKRIWIC